MLKGSQIVLLLLLLIVIGGIGSYLYFNRAGKYVPAAMAVPGNAVLVFQGKQPDKMMNEIWSGEVYKSLAGQGPAAEIRNEYRYLDSLFRTSEDIHEAVAGNPIVICLNTPASNSMHLLALLPASGKLDKSDIEDVLQEHVKDARIFEREFQGEKIYDVKGAGKTGLFSFAFPQGILAISRDPLSVEDAIVASTSNRATNNPFVRLMVERQEEEKVYVNFVRLPVFLSYFASAENHAFLRQAAQLEGYGVYDVRSGKEDLRLTGILQTNTPAGTYWKCLQNQRPQTYGLQQVLPNSTALYFNWAVSDFKSYYDNYLEFLKGRDLLNGHETAAQELGAQGVSLSGDLVPWMGNEWGLAVLEPAGEGDTLQKVLVVKPADTAAAISGLGTFNKKYIRSLPPDHLPSVHRGFPIQRMSYQGAFPLLLGEAFGEFERPYYVRLGGYVLFASEQSTIIRCINSFAENQVLAHAGVYKSLASVAGTTGNFFAYVNPGKSTLIADRFVNEEFAASLQRNATIYRQCGPFGFSLTSAPEGFKSEMILLPASSRNTAADVVWSFKMESEPAGKPFIFNNPGMREQLILMQDKSNNLYALNIGGELRWKRQVGEPIVGEIKPINLYKNEQVQFLFATPTRLFLVEEDGRDAGTYPLRLGSSTSTGVATFDFNNDKDVYIFVEGEGNRIFGYFANGRPLPGWASTVSDGRLSQPLKSFSLQGKPYLLGVTRRGTIHIWDKDGRQAVKPVVLKAGVNRPVEFVFGPSLEQCKVLAMDTSGILHIAGLDGKESRKNFRRFGSNPFFEYEDTDGNGKSEYIVAGNKTIAAFEADSSVQWKLVTSENLPSAPQLITLAGKTYVGYLNTVSDKVYLFTRAGTPFGNFPQRGSTPFAISDLNTTGDKGMVIGGQGKMLYLYRLSL